ncbi:MAG: hypothetical protein ABJJ53_12860 [Sulfitobacter sp.]
MTPEVRILLVQVSSIVFAYTTIFPWFKAVTLRAMTRINIAFLAVLLPLFGIAYAGKGIGFSMLLFDMPWWLFVLISGMLIDTPFFIWYCRKHNIDMAPPKE